MADYAYSCRYNGTGYHGTHTHPGSYLYSAVRRTYLYSAVHNQHILDWSYLVLLLVLFWYRYYMYVAVAPDRYIPVRMYLVAVHVDLYVPVLVYLY